MYYLVYGLLYIISLLPLRVLYVVSDFVYVVLYYLVGYRRKVVFANLKRAFPEKSQEELKAIAKRFYKNFTDNFIEFIKLISASPEFIARHFYGDCSLLDSLYQEGKRAQIQLAHNFNWEGACVAIAARAKQPFIVVYMPIGNKVVDKIFLKVRSRTGAILLPATDMRNAIIRYRSLSYLLILVADQNPGNPGKALWYNFFGKATPFLKAPESGARRGNTPVLFSKFIKERRGYYRIIFEMGEENPGSLKEGELTKKYVEYLHDFVSEHPEMWLWSHRRWKWDWKEQYGPIIG
jgi:Kdo2-lipid IVA lauroyltransferase/acyltransferase